MSLRKQKKEDKLLRIERAGRELFSKQGFDATTTRALARHAGIGTGTFFVYFPHKLDLLVHLFLEDVGEVIDDAFATMPPELLLVESMMHVCGKLYAYYDRDPRLSRAFMKEMIFLEVRPANEMTKTTLHRHGTALSGLMMRFAGLIQAAKARGELPARAIELEVLYHLFGAYYWGLMTRLGGMMPPSEQRRMLERALKAIVVGIRQMD